MPMKAMRLNLLARVSASVFSIFLSTIFISHSIQPYVPPSIQNSISYSIVNCHCPLYAIQISVSHLIHYISKSKGEEGTEKHCFCFNCSIQRSSFIIVKPSINFLIDEYRAYLFALDQNLPLKEFYKNISIRSPPMLSS